MRLLSLDFDPVYGEDATRASFAGDVSVFDHDVVIWDPEMTFATYTRHSGQYRNLPSLSEHSSVQIQADAKRRRAEFTEFINSGRVLVVIVRPPQQCYIDTGERSYSGTGRNRQTTRILGEFDLLSALPIPSDASFTTASGSRITVSAGGPLADLLRKYAERLSYSAVISRAPGSPLAHVTGTSRQVASVQRSTAGGHLILMPPVDLERSFENEEEALDDDDIWMDGAHEFQVDLLAAIEGLAGKVSARPQWADRFATAEQTKIRESITARQKRIESSRAKLAKLQQEAEAAESRDQLFLGTGRALELEVREVLQLLGGTVTEPEPGRDDWRVSFGTARAVVEVKGVVKSAAEKHAAQLEKWVATALEESGEAPKGLLVVNTWRETPLDERTEADFPDQMLKYCIGREHCLVTGLQMFVIREEIEADPSRAEYWRKALLDTAGVLLEARDWQNYLLPSREGQ